MSPAPTTINAQSTADLMAMPPREFILLGGKDGSGKSSAIVSLAALIQIMNPDARFYVVDTENKFPTALRSFGADAPTNITYYKTETMNDVTNVTEKIMGERREGDWVAVESKARVWERSQDLGYKATSGYDKIDYLEKRRKVPGAPVIPNPDAFWSIVKGAHDSAFLDLLSQASSLNVILSTTISRPPNSKSFIKENDTRKAVRLEFGIDSGIDGAPRLPYYAETLALMEAKGESMVCRVIRDNNNQTDNNRPEFAVADKKAWAIQFWSHCRG